MITPEDVYAEFRRAQAESKNRPYRLPKNFETFMEKRMSEKNREALVLATKFFNTKWKNINPFRYFECGFELYKSFSYVMFFHRPVMELYIRKDKHLKRDLNDAKMGLVNSLRFVLPYMKEHNIPSIGRYCQIREQRQSLPVKHYLENKIDKYFIVLLINMAYLHLDDDELMMMPYVAEHYRSMLMQFKEIGSFIQRVKEKL